MKIIWQFDSEALAKAKDFFTKQQDDFFVHRRIAANLAQEKPPVTRDDFWHRMIGCLLTSQQRAGPNSPTTKFLILKPFPLSYSVCKQHDDLIEFASRTMGEFGGLRYYNNISKYLALNLDFLEDGRWNTVFERLEEVRRNSTPRTERRAAAFIDKTLKGFGPKQSRNLLQGLGLSRHEIPIDSRITDWLNSMGFPVKLGAKKNALQDENYYNFVSEGFQRLCGAIDVMPCVMDAAIFSSFDDGGWNEENVVW